MTPPQDWMRPADESMLEFLDRNGPEMQPFIAARTGTHLPYAEERCAELERHGFVRRLDDGRLELTECGRRYLSGTETDCSTERAAEAD